jgi:hypothetical protein
MTDADSSAPDFTLDELSERIETWRQTRKKRPGKHVFSGKTTPGTNFVFLARLKCTENTVAMLYEGRNRFLQYGVLATSC